MGAPPEAGSSEASDRERPRAGAAREKERVLLLILGLNVAVAIAKAVYGIASGSLAVLSDALHSLMDGTNNVLGVIAIRFAGRPPDDRHPYGYRRLEGLAALGLGVLLGVFAVEFGWTAFRALLAGATAPPVSASGVVILGLTLVVNVFVARYERRRARELKSPFLEADAAHTASDVIVTVAVLASQLGAYLGLRFADPVAAVIVLGLVGKVAAEILWGNLRRLMDSASIDGRRVEEVALGVEGTLGCHRVRSRGVEGAVHLDLHLIVPRTATLVEAHAISHAVEERLRAELPDLVDVTIHVEPEGDPEDPL